jgi:DNA polymerase elongation subunit (family B)
LTRESQILIPKGLALMKQYVPLLRTGAMPTGELIITKRVSKAPEEYSNLDEQAIAATHLIREGESIHAGQTVNYIITHNQSTISHNRSLPAELVDESTHYDSERYAELLLSSSTDLLLPFQFDIEVLRREVQA